MSFKSAIIPAGVNMEDTPPIVKEDSLAISVQDLGKCYNIYENPQDKLKEVLSFGRRIYNREFWALKNVSFDIKKGETVGIVGRNGSGKSTLLQIISGTLAPTLGCVHIQGRVAALLELGSGFSPEFTGKENVYMNASVLGLCKEEIDERYESILDFADIGDFINQPVKTYSSGMYIRLAFAVAVNVDPDILVVDEALSVGDEIFQRKCFSRIHSIKDMGATILFVSHAAGAVIELCNRAYLLDRGEVILNASPKVAISKYQQLIYASPSDQESMRSEILAIDTLHEPIKTPPKKEIIKPAVTQDPSGVAYFDPNLVPKSGFSYRSRGARISNPRILTLAGGVVNHLVRREQYIYAFTVDFLENSFSVRAAMSIKTIRGIELGGAVSSRRTDRIPNIEAGARLNVKFKFQCLLVPGTYFLNAGVKGMVSNEETFLDRRIDAAIFKVQPEKDGIPTVTVDFLIEPFVEYRENMLGKK